MKIIKLLAHLLEVKLREDVQPVGELNDEEELEEEGHAGVRVALPERCNAQKIFPELKIVLKNLESRCQ